MLDGLKEVVVCGFEQLRSYQDEKETWNWEQIFYSYGENGIKDIRCRSNTDRITQGDTCTISGYIVFI